MRLLGDELGISPQDVGLMHARCPKLTAVSFVKISRVKLVLMGCLGLSVRAP